MIGRTLSHYRIVDEISRGGMGVVYRAVDVRLNREVALKVLPPELVSDADRKRRFVQEAQAASALEHPHIAVIHEIDEADGVTFIAMELIRGEKLGDLVARRRLPVARTLELAMEIAEGLARAHEKSIVHRDLKPANVMITDEGHAKIIDFGLAKLVERPEGLLASRETKLAGATDSGVILGTVAYMSPEQASGDKVDHRSDIFSFGILLYEMLAGRVPFEGRTSVDVLHAILNQPAPPISALGPGISPSAEAGLQRLLDKCLAKDPADRYQGMRDVVVDVRAARRTLESASFVSATPLATPAASSPGASGVTMPSAPTVPTTTSVARHRPLWLIGAAAAVIVAGLGLVAWRHFASSSTAPASASSGKPSVAVLYFENNTGNPSLDWLRTGLTDMVVTDLSQSPDIEVLGTDRLYQILNELKRADDRVISFDVVQELARRAGVNTVLLGSYVKAGETIRINVKLQEAGSGKILSSERAEAIGESNLFMMVDDLTRRIKSRFALPGDTQAIARGLLPSGPATAVRDVPGFDRGLKEITTSSLEAYRYYAEGINLHERSKEAESVPLFEKAVGIDPGFAMAYAKLAVVHGNLGHPSERQKYSKLALDHSERLSQRERFYIEGVHFSEQPQTVARAIDAYRKAVELYPDHSAARNNLALIYRDMGRFREAIEHGEELRRRGMIFPGSYAILSDSYTAVGDFDRATQVLLEYTQRNPENAGGYRNLAEHFVAWDKLDEALRSYEKADALEPDHIFVRTGRWLIFIIRGQWSDAERTARQLSGESDSFSRWLGATNLAIAELYRGKTRQALQHFDEASRAYRTPGFFTAVAQVNAANLLLDRGEPALALARAERARREASQMATESAAGAAAIAQALLGRHADTEQTLQPVKQLSESLPSDTAKRNYHQFAGQVAFAAGDAVRAVDELTRAEALLPARPVTGPPPPHVPIWYALASAHLARGDEANATARFTRIVESGAARVAWPIPYVRSLYFLGKIHEKRGDMTKAREYYRRFLDYWKDGDIDRERVAEALEKTK